MLLDPSTISPSQWRDYYIYSLCRLTTVVTHYVKVLRPGGDYMTKDQRDFFQELLKELAWTHTMAQSAATASNKSVKDLHGWTFLRDVTYYCTEDNWNRNINMFKNILENAADDAALHGLELSWNSWWHEKPYECAHITFDSFIFGFELDQERVAGVGILVQLAQRESEVDRVFAHITHNKDKEKAEAEKKLLETRALAEATLHHLTTTKMELKAKMDKTIIKVTAMGGHLDIKAQEKFMRRVASGKLDKDIEMAVGNFADNLL
ncbi:hypothetical protein NMY22_g16846 [Coprinellus aureogranulatus]|nr:hypothetical protein NMY22_g16846 [Coprinellus aureogranulatus]